MTLDSARGRALGGPTSFLFFGQFLSPIGPRPLAEVIDLTTAFACVGAVMVIGVVSFGLAAVIMPPPAEPELESDDGGLTDPTDLTTPTQFFSNLPSGKSELMTTPPLMKNEVRAI